MVASIIVSIYLNRDVINTVVGWRNFCVYVGFNLLIMLLGVSLGSAKETMKRLYGILDGEGSEEMRLNESLHVLKLAGATASVAFEKYNESLPKKIKKSKEKADKEAAKTPKK